MSQVNSHMKVASHETSHGSLVSYFIGFCSSLLLTFASFGLVYYHPLALNWTIAVISLLAITQFVVQLTLFMHIGTETKPRWKLFTFWFMLMVVIIIILGSIWIMNNLNYRMTPMEMNKYMQSQDGL